MARNGLWKLSKNKALQDRGALPREEGDVIREFQAMKEENTAQLVEEDGKGQTKREMEVDEEVGEDREVTEMAKKVMKKLKEEVEKKGFKLSVTENEKGGKSKMIASCGFLEDELRQCSKEEGVTMADSVETLGVDLRTRVKNLGAKEKARRKKCKVRFSLLRRITLSRRTT